MTKEEVLREHVYESNLIEGIEVDPGDPLFDSHLEAARIAARGRIVHPNYLHHVLTRGVTEMLYFGGKYRRCNVRVGRDICPHWKEVRRLMLQWTELVDDFATYGTTTEDIAFCAFTHQEHFLCIHPYQDGNGRTGRLVWNMLRVSRGLPWQIEPAETKWEYYAKIVDYRNRVFNEHYPDVYP